MDNFPTILCAIQADARYQRHLDWGVPRRGHPEGTVRAHIRELEDNLRSLAGQIAERDRDKLRLLIHTHDTFKAEARPGVPIEDPRSHASLARGFLAEFCHDADLLAMVQFHDEPYALWKQDQTGGSISARLERLLGAVEDWDLLLVFLIIDGCTRGKSREPLIWFFHQLDGRVNAQVTLHWLL